MNGVQAAEAVAAPGTDPTMLLRVLARLLGPRGDPHTTAREAAVRAADGDPAPLERLAPLPTPEAARAAGAAARRWARLGVRAALAGDASYPPRLRPAWPLGGAPPLVAWRGGEALPADRAAVAIIGARRATGYGVGVAAWLAASASDAGVLVVSGGALGIDSAAHGAALDGPGGTAVVLGCGHAVAYPSGNARPGGLFDRVLAGGGWLLSELPPDTPPRPPHVLARNRIVVGLVDAVVVVEGGERSGTLRTAEVAAEQGVPVLAVPGDVRAPGSVAPHRLLADGAAPCTGPGDLLDALGVGGPSAEGGTVPTTLPEPVAAELARRWPRPVRLDDLAAATQVPAARLLGAITRARVAGEVADGPDGLRLTRAPGRRRAGR